MKGRLPLFVILGSSLTFLASLYLPWVVPNADPLKQFFSSGQGSRGPSSLLTLFSQSSLGFGHEGWTAFGEAAALAALALALCALIALIRPELEARLPLGGCAIALVVLTLVNATPLWASNSTVRGLAFHLDTGAYLGGAAALTAFLSAAWVSRDEISELGNAVAATLLTIGLVAAYVLPSLATHNPLSVFEGSHGTAIMLLIASFGLSFWFGARAPLRRLAAAAVTLVLVVGGLSVLGTHTHWPYEAWLAIGCATGLLALAAASGRDRLTLGRADTVALAGATLLLASLFFNWLVLSCGSGRTCYVVNGWGGGLTGGLAGILVVLLLGFRYLSPELAVTIAIYVFGAAFAYTTHASLSYGAYLGFAGAALLLIAVGLKPRKHIRGGVRLVPVAASVAFLAIPVATITGRLSQNFEIDAEWRLALLEAAAIVVGLRLIGRWLSGPAADLELLVLPVALVALTGLDLGERQHAYSIGWEGWLALALSMLLLVLGWIGQRGGLDDFRIPDEIWRVDRISSAEN